jgi:hypothetical protein
MSVLVDRLRPCTPEESGVEQLTGSSTPSYKRLALFLLRVASFMVSSAIIALPVVLLRLPKNGLPGEQGSDGGG